MSEVAVEGVSGHGEGFLSGSASFVAERDLSGRLGQGGAARNERSPAANQTEQKRTPGLPVRE